jgi:hypothetical protein
MANYRKVPDQIPAWCESHGAFVKHLNKSKYGHEFGISSSTTGTRKQPSWYRISERLRFDVLERDGFFCVWCGERAGEQRIVDVRAIAQLGARDLDGEAGIVEWGVDEVDSEKTFFGHDADHLFTPSDVELVRGHVKATTLDIMAREWIVASCARCNRGRRENPSPVRALLAVYARHLLERTGKPDWEDLTLFAATARMVALRRSAVAATGTAG